MISIADILAVQFPQIDMTGSPLFGGPWRDTVEEQFWRNRPGASQMREIRIQAVLNGFIVTVGCQTLVVENKNKLLVELGRYIDNPAEMEKEYLSKFDNSYKNPESLLHATLAMPQDDGSCEPVATAATRRNRV